MAEHSAQAADSAHTFCENKDLAKNFTSFND